MKEVLAAFAVVILLIATVFALDVWSVGWIKHDGTITVTIPDNQKGLFDYAY